MTETQIWKNNHGITETSELNTTTVNKTGDGWRRIDSGPINVVPVGSGNKRRYRRRTLCECELVKTLGPVETVDKT